ncbi:MAG TPA: hypothetical protein VFK44_02300 [Bacillales bacterium]|nr:hypothetical protein [Bacillales bacterium]
MQQTCICVAADVKRSKELDSRQLTVSLKKIVEQLNQDFQSGILIPFAVRNGDEIVGVLRSFPSGYRAGMNMIRSASKTGMALYVGMGTGTLDHPEATVHTMNGTAVVHAFKARDDYLKNEHPDAKSWQFQDPGESAVFFYQRNFPYQAVNALIFAILEKRYRRTGKQNEVIERIQQNPELSYEQIGEQLGYKSPKSTVSYLLSRADFQLVRAMEESLLELLEDWQQRLEKEGD